MARRWWRPAILGGGREYTWAKRMKFKKLCLLLLDRVSTQVVYFVVTLTLPVESGARGALGFSFSTVMRSIPVQLLSSQTVLCTG